MKSTPILPTRFTRSTETTPLSRRRQARQGPLPRSLWDTRTLLSAACLSYMLLAGCATAYRLDYGVVLKSHGGKDGLTIEEGLKAKDEHFTFEFMPTPAGIAFSIRTLTHTEATIDWDKSFFVQPDGNSYKALNTEAQEEHGIVAMKSQNVTIIPRSARVARFTTASVNPRSDSYVTVDSVRNILSSTRLKWAPSDPDDTKSAAGWIWTPSYVNTTFSSLVVGSALTSNQFPRYRELEVIATEDEVQRKLADVSKDTWSRPGMSLGLTILSGETKTTYNFEFEIVSIFASATYDEAIGAPQNPASPASDPDDGGHQNSSREKYRSVERLAFLCRADNGWAWEDLRPKKPVAELPPKPIVSD